ncbi:tyrosine-type recombinase/integrase [Streptomyces sp. NBC_01020]|uniref:tyrosine-type recombinase/integrase n=1 Tax=Streptomyces sp. NBC_01020 TaxID=2903722 RepID=UPI003865A295
MPPTCPQTGPRGRRNGVLLVPHSIRHSYVTHLTEDGIDRRFIQQQVGHDCDSSTAIYTHVSNDFMNTALSKALAPAFAGV